MKLLNFLKNYSAVVVASGLLLISSVVITTISKPPIVISKQEATWNLNNQMLRRFNLGYKRLASSFLWISTILESDIDHYKKRDLNSWMFLRFNSISELEPRFYENYAFGGPYLSIVKDDLSGAGIIYDKGLKEFPEDYYLLKDAGFHYHFEVGDYAKSYKIFSKLKQNPRTNPMIVSSLARLETERGNLQVAFELLSAQLQALGDQNSFLANKIKMDLYAIKAEIDLNCLNQGLNNCSKEDFYQKAYLNSKGKYFAAISWTPFRIKKNIRR